jgi:hypothetical protein
MSIFAALMKKTGLFFTLMGTALFLLMQTSCKTDPVPVKNLASETSLLNGKCPEMVDEETRLDSVVLSTEGKLVYYYTMTQRTSANVNALAFKAYLIPAILENVRNNGSLRMFRDSSVSMEFNYRDLNGEFVTEISIEPAQYQ